MRSVFLFLAVTVFSTASCSNPVYSEIILDLDTGVVIHEYNPDKQTQPASLTKIMTLYIVFSKLASGELRMRDTVFFTRNATNQKPCKLDITHGDCMTVRDAIKALITKSANDVAVALAEKISGSEENFVKLMNVYAQNLGLKYTVFQNASGWKNKKQLTTARDCAILTTAMIRNHRNYYRLFRTKVFCYDGKKYKNHNNLLGSHNDFSFHVDGVKTGYVAASGYNLSASATNSYGKRIVAVILGGPTAKWRDDRMKYIISCAFSKKSPSTPNIREYYEKENRPINKEKRKLCKANKKCKKNSRVYKKASLKKTKSSIEKRGKNESKNIKS